MLFTSIQAYEYIHAPFAFKNSIFGSTFFMATGFHGFHVIVGTIFLLVCLLRANAGQFTPKQHLGFEFAAWYWHFVDVVWLFLFSAIYVWGSWGATFARGLSFFRASDRPARTCFGPVCYAAGRKAVRLLKMSSDPFPTRAAILGKCPQCGEGNLFDGFLQPRAGLRPLRPRLQIRRRGRRSGGFRHSCWRVFSSSASRSGSN